MVPLCVIPILFPVTVKPVITRTSPFASVAPLSRSIEVKASTSVTLRVSGALTTGAALLCVMVMVAVCATDKPVVSVML